VRSVSRFRVAAVLVATAPLLVGVARPAGASPTGPTKCSGSGTVSNYWRAYWGSGTCTDAAGTSTTMSFQNSAPVGYLGTGVASVVFGCGREEPVPPVYAMGDIPMTMTFTDPAGTTTSMSQYWSLMPAALGLAGGIGGSPVFLTLIRDAQGSGAGSQILGRALTATTSDSCTRSFGTSQTFDFHIVLD
jgi:hypothetical protein